MRVLCLACARRLCRPEPFVVTLFRVGSATALASRGRAEPAEAPSAVEGGGTTAAPRPFTEFTLGEAEGFRAARKRPSRSFQPAWAWIRDGRLRAALNEVKGLGMRVPSLALRTAQKERRFGAAATRENDKQAISRLGAVTIICGTQ
ncbi:MAG: hypothetical protein JOZ29_21765 [Deltaproteobacteria bacterium]|nr:hypothetical protein [Deltaproteobacteria bacterium]